MSKTAARAPLLALSIDRAASAPMHRQVFDQIRDAILNGRLTPGHRLPSSRSLAADLAVSRNTVLIAYDQLLAEGYTEGKVGAGTRVSKILPDDVLRARAVSRPAAGTGCGGTRLSRSGQDVLGGAMRVDRRPTARAFRPGLPEIDRFPWNAWSRMVGKFWRHPPRGLMSYGEPAGYRPLRDAIASYLGAVRGLRCSAEQVIITAGAQQAIDLAARALVDPGDRVWVEDPGYAGIKSVMTAVGADIVPVPVDGDGLRFEDGLRAAPDARMAVVTPSHQYPTGAVLSLPRRLALIAWARDNGAWVLEDDYDSEYRYAGRPLSAMQGLDADGRIIYVGTFSKVLFPAIRLGYLVVPPALIEPMTEIRLSLDDQTAIAMQPVLAEFMESGHFAAHIRRMRTLYAERQQVLIAAVREHLDGVLRVEPDEAGMHLIGDIAPAAGIEDTTIADRAAAAGLTVYPLSKFYLGPAARNGVLLGYAGLEARDIRAAVAKLAKAMG